MTRNEEIAKAIEAYGKDIRCDWSDFDGRTAQYVLSFLAHKLRNPDEPFNLDEWLKDNIREDYV